VLDTYLLDIDGVMTRTDEYMIKRMDRLGLEFENKHEMYRNEKTKTIFLNPREAIKIPFYKDALEFIRNRPKAKFIFITARPKKLNNIFLASLDMGDINTEEMIVYNTFHAHFNRRCMHTKAHILESITRHMNGVNVKLYVDDYMANINEGRQFCDSYFMLRDESEISDYQKTIRSFSDLSDL